MSWLQRLLGGYRVSLPEDTIDLDEVRRDRAEAERKLRETQVQGRAVRNVARAALRIREDNQFSARLDQAFGSRKQ